MELSYWQEKWEGGQVAFHENKPNALLVKHAGKLDDQKRVLVPLSGKSQDLWFLAKREHEVVGVEFVEKAAKAAFAQAGVGYDAEPLGKFRALKGGGVVQLVGDFFDATPNVVGMFDAAYDRAALVAVDPPTRRKYVEVLASLLAPGAPVLLVTLTYDQKLIGGPPWSVSDDEVRALFASAFDVERLESRDAEPSPKMKEAGASIVETIWSLQKRAE
jgi:thiopurine S-methyltransferase